MNANFIDVICWFGRSENSNEEQFRFYKQTSDKNHFDGNFEAGLCIFNRYGSYKNEPEGRKIMKEVFLCEDRFWTFVYACYIENSLFWFEQD